MSFLCHLLDFSDGWGISADILRLRTISDADLIIVLRDGQVAEQGSHEELLKIEGGVYQRLWVAQLSENTSSIPGEGEGVKEKEVISLENKK